MRAVGVAQESRFLMDAYRSKYYNTRYAIFRLRSPRFGGHRFAHPPKPCSFSSAPTASTPKKSTRERISAMRANPNVSRNNLRRSIVGTSSSFLCCHSEHGNAGAVRFAEKTRTRGTKHRNRFVSSVSSSFRYFAPRRWQWCLTVTCERTRVMCKLHISWQPRSAQHGSILCT